MDERMRSQYETTPLAHTSLADSHSPIGSPSLLTRIVHVRRSLPGFTILLTAAITLPISATIALQRAHYDGATFIYMGEMWTKGMVPYVQLFDNKPPGIFALMAVAALTHHTIWAVALIEFLFVMAGVFTFRRILQICGSPKNTVFFGTLAAALTANLHAYGAGNLPETYLLWPMTASMLAFCRALESRNVRFVFLAGICSGVACMFKPFGLSILFAQVISPSFSCGRGVDRSSGPRRTALVQSPPGLSAGLFFNASRPEGNARRVVLIQRALRIGIGAVCLGHFVDDCGQATPRFHHGDVSCIRSCWVAKSIPRRTKPA